MPRFEHSIAQLTQSLTTSNGWLEIAKSRLGISIQMILKSGKGLLINTKRK